MKPKGLGCLILAGVMVIGYAGLLLMPSRARRALPWGASEIQENYSDGMFGVDYERCLRARIKESEFDAFADRLHLDRTYTIQDHHLPLSWVCTHSDWFSPPESLLGARFEYTEGEDNFAMAKYHEGYVYFVAFSW